MIARRLVGALAEESGSVVQLDDWVLHTACRQLKQGANRDLKLHQVVVNVSAVQLRRAHLVQSLRAALHKTGIVPDQLEQDTSFKTLVDQWLWTR